MHYSVLLICGLIILCGDTAGAGRRTGYDSTHLDAALYHYDTLHTSELIHEPHPLPHLQLVSFHALDRDFRLLLRPDRRTLTANFQVFSVAKNGTKMPHHMNSDLFLCGHWLGVANSHVTAHLSEGILSAVVATPTTIYHIEPSAHLIHGSHDFHMIVYDHAHVRPRLNATRMDFVNPPHPQSDELTKHTMGSEVMPGGGMGRRVRRQARSGRIGGDFCDMALVADHTVFQQFGRSVSSVSRQLVLIVSTVNSMIYSRTDWIVDISGNTESNLGLTIEQVIVHETANTSPTHYNTDRTDVDATDILSFMRLEDWRESCLVHLFTSRSFSSGLLGLANIASPLPSQTGGICSTRFRDSSNDVVIYNTGLSSFLNGGVVMVVSEMVRVVGHEVGHNWGSFHDPSGDPECSSFIMNEYAQDGSNPTHFLFSACSRRAIGTVLLSKGTCFGAAGGTMCGNYRVEEEELCDAGPEGDSCCTSTCMLTEAATCSDSNSPCCMDCQYANSSVVCRSSPTITSDCRGDTFCNGLVETCSGSRVVVPDGQPCVNGMCQLVNGSVGETECVPVCGEFCACDGVEECLVCCLEGGRCALANSTILLSDGSQCSNGICVDGVCSDRTQDNIARIWRIISSLDANEFRILLMENIVGVVLIITAPVWALLGLLVHLCVDKPRDRRFQKAFDKTDLGNWVAATSWVDMKNKPSIPEVQTPLLSHIDEVEEEDLQVVAPVDY